MVYFYLLAGGGIATFVHFYLVWLHRGKSKYSVSDYAITEKKSHLIYIVAHILCEILLLLFSYEFYLVQTRHSVLHYLIINFVIFDFIQAVVPWRGKTKQLHLIAAYISWLSYFISGILAFFLLPILPLNRMLSLIFLLPATGCLVYMHVNRNDTTVYIYQLAIVPLFVLFMLTIVMGTG